MSGPKSCPPLGSGFPSSSKKSPPRPSASGTSFISSSSSGGSVAGPGTPRPALWVTWPSPSEEVTVQKPSDGASMARRRWSVTHLTASWSMNAVMPWCAFRHNVSCASFFSLLVLGMAAACLLVYELITLSRMEISSRS